LTRPASRQVTAEAVRRNYTTYLNIVFLLLGTALLVRYFRSCATPMLKIGGSPAPASNQPTAGHLDHDRRQTPAYEIFRAHG
jgi:hypothetical protein